MTYYYWDEVNDNLFGEEDDNGAVVASYTYEPGLYGELIAQERDGETRYYNYDGLGNTSELTDENENVTDTYEYSAFGEEVARTGTTKNAFGYKGAVGYYTNGEAKDIYVRERVYAPTIARWLSRDPIGFSAGPNVYEYGYGDPIGSVDPSGLQVMDFETCRCPECLCGTISVQRNGPRIAPYKSVYLLCYHFRVTVPTTGNCECTLTQYKRGNMYKSTDGGKTWVSPPPITSFEYDLHCPKWFAPKQFCKQECNTLGKCRLRPGSEPILQPVAARQLATRHVVLRRKSFCCRTIRVPKA